LLLCEHALHAVSICRFILIFADKEPQQVQTLFDADSNFGLFTILLVILYMGREVHVTVDIPL